MTDEEDRQAMIAELTAGFQCLDLETLAEICRLIIDHLSKKIAEEEKFERDIGLN